MWHFVTKVLGVQETNLRWRRHTDTERSHYSKDTYDLDYQFPFGFKELWGIAYRTDYDLKQHMHHSGQSLEYIDPLTHQKLVPHVIEPAVGLDRIFLMVMCDAYWEDTANERTVLRIKPELAPYHVAIFPLLKNKPELVEKAREIYQTIKPHFRTIWDDRGNIGKRYYYQDEVGTPYCITVDFETLENQTVTIRERDSMQQERIAVTSLQEFLNERL
jgi:glycyl-tRNA synthetase